VVDVKNIVFDDCVRIAFERLIDRVSSSGMRQPRIMANTTEPGAGHRHPLLRHMESGLTTVGRRNARRERSEGKNPRL
jgi:hypothetical protein